MDYCAEAFKQRFGVELRHGQRPKSGDASENERALRSVNTLGCREQIEIRKKNRRHGDASKHRDKPGSCCPDTIVVLRGIRRDDDVGEELPVFCIENRIVNAEWFG